MEPTPVSLGYLLDCSTIDLESVVLSRLNNVDLLRKEFRNLVERGVQAEVDLRLARGILFRRRDEFSRGRRKIAGSFLKQPCEQLAMPSLHEPASDEKPMLPAAAGGGRVNVLRVVDRNYGCELSALQATSQPSRCVPGAAKRTHRESKGRPVDPVIFERAELQKVFGPVKMHSLRPARR